MEKWLFREGKVGWAWVRLWELRFRTNGEKRVEEWVMVYGVPTKIRDGRLRSILTSILCITRT